MTFGILTLATPGDYRKAIGLALSARVSNPGIPVAVACSPRIKLLLQPYFDYVVDEDPSLRGFVHKIHLDRYTPFDETFFFDSDVLLFRSLNEVAEDWRQQAFSACGRYVTDGFSTFGLDHARVLERIKCDRLAHVEGAGHYYFRKPDCQRVFDLAREITADYAKYADGARFADEDAIGIAMTLLGVRPMPYGEFIARYLTATPGTVKMDASSAKCEFISVDTGRPMQPLMMHFASDEAPFPYARQLVRLFRQNNVDTRGLYQTAMADFYRQEILWPAKAIVKKGIAALLPVSK